MGYYDISEVSSLEEILERWMDGDKAYDPEGRRYHAKFSADELWPYREYEWTRESAGGGVVHGGLGSYEDKWVHLDDEEGRVGVDKWDAMVEDMGRRGWSERDPAFVEVGKNGVMKVGEGNHRLAIARELGIDVPVFFQFKWDVEFDVNSNRRGV